LKTKTTMTHGDGNPNQILIWYGHKNVTNYLSCEPVVWKLIGLESSESICIFILFQWSLEQLIVHFFIFLILLAIAVLKNILFINSKLCFKVDNTNHFLNLLILSSMVYTDFVLFRVGFKTCFTVLGNYSCTSNWNLWRYILYIFF
jgi:hypothetical protein